MLTFQYKAATPDGCVVNGTMSGNDRAEIVARLHSSGHIPIRVDEAAVPKTTRKRLVPRSQKSVDDRQVADFTRDLATLLRAGIPLDRALTMLASMSPDSALGDIVTALTDSVKQGSTFADAIAHRDKVFNRFYVNMVRAGANAGALEEVLDRLSGHLERSKEIRDSLVSALIYPAILVIVAITSVLILLGYVVPQFADMFASAGETLPLSTRITIAVGELIKSWGWVIPLVVAATVLTLRQQLRDPRRKLKLHDAMLRLPIAGEILLKAEVARFARTLSTLLQNGVTLLQALSIARDTMDNERLAADIEKVGAGLKEGQRLADPLAANTGFPAFAIHMIRVGEETGNLQDILVQVADAYERDTNTTIKRALALLEPALILVLGGVIAAVIISILVAILSVNELVI